MAAQETVGEWHGPVAFLVTLPGDEARCAPTEAALRSLGIPYRIAHGVDLRPGSPTDLGQLVDAGEVAQSAADRLHPGSIGCSLSHQHIYRTIVEEDLPLALVLEDDVMPEAHLRDVLADPTPFLFDDRVTMLAYAHHGGDDFLVSTQDTVPIAGGAVHLPLDGRFRTTAAYLVTSGAARRLIDANAPVEFPADGWDQYLHRRALAAMQIVHPAPIAYRDDVPSTRLSTARSEPWTASAAATLKRWLNPATTPPVAWLKHRRVQRVRVKSRIPVLVDRPSPFRDPAPLDDRQS